MALKVGQKVLFAAGKGRGEGKVSFISDNGKVEIETANGRTVIRNADKVTKAGK